MPTADSPIRPGGLIPRWLPFPATSAWLLFLIGTVWLLRRSVVLPKALVKAREHWEAARHGTGGAFKWEDAAALGTHLSTLAALPVLTLAFLTVKWWHPDSMPPAPVPTARSRRRWFFPGLAGLMILAAVLRLPLASGSLWWDELWNIKYATIGEWRQDEANPDVVRFQPSSWQRAAWYYNKPTNHPVLTLPSKAAHEIWRLTTRPADPGAFNEIVLRLPVLAGGLAAITLTALLARRLAGDQAGLPAAALMALHPWLIRYGMDARGYGLTVFFMAAALFSLERATAPESRRPALWWWVTGACQFFLMWSHVVANLAVCASLFTVAAVLILRGNASQKGRNLARLTVINLIAAALLLVAFLPNLMQAMTWGERNDDGNLLTGPYFIRTLTQIIAGMDPPPGSGTPGIPFLGWTGAGLLLLLGTAAVLTGLRFLWRSERRALWIPLGALTGTALFLIVVKLTGFYFYHRFILTAAVPLLLLAAIGLSRLRPAWLVFPPLGLFVFLTVPGTRLLLTRSYAPFRETVQDMNAQTKAGSPPPLLVGYGLGSHVMQCYAPALRDIRTDATPALQALIDQARRENRPLLVALGYEELNRLNLPDGFRLLDDPALFEKISTRHGIEPEFTFHLLRLKPSP